MSFKYDDAAPLPGFFVRFLERDHTGYVSMNYRRLYCSLSVEVFEGDIVTEKKSWLAEIDRQWFAHLERTLPRPEFYKNLFSAA